MSVSRTKMISALKETVIPKLRAAGFSGSFPHFRRPKDDVIDLLTFQFNKWGGSFVVEVASCPATGAKIYTGEIVSPKTVTAHDINCRLRLGSNPPKKMDYWFDFASVTYGEKIYRMAAEDVLAHLPQAERYWEFQR